MTVTTKTNYTLDMSGCACCYASACTWCGFCSTARTPVVAIVTFSGFTGWATAMNRSVVVELGNTCNSTSGCILEGYWSGISCAGWSYPIWRKVRLEIFSATRYVISLHSPNDATDPCASDQTTALAVDLNPTFDNGGGGTQNFDTNKCNEPGVAGGTTAAVNLSASANGVMCCVACGGGSDDTVSTLGAVATVQVVSVASLASIVTLTFTGTCAATLGGTVTMTWNNTTKKYTGTNALCNMSYEYDPCAGSLTGTGDCTVSGSTSVTDLNPYAAECTSLTIGIGCACCAVADGLTTGFTIAP